MFNEYKSLFQRGFYVLMILYYSKEQSLADIKLHLDSFKGSINMGPFLIFKPNKSLKLDLINQYQY